MDPQQQQNLYAAALTDPTASMTNPMGPDFQMGQTMAPALAQAGSAIARLPGRAEQALQQDPQTANLVRYAVSNSEAGMAPNLTGNAANYITQLMRGTLVPTGQWAARMGLSHVPGAPQIP